MATLVGEDTEPMLLIEPREPERVLEISPTGEYLEELEMSALERHIRVLQQLPLSALLSSTNVEEEDDCDEETPVATPPPPVPASHGPTPELMAKLQAAHAEATQLRALVELLRDERKQGRRPACDPYEHVPTEAPDAIELTRYRKKEELGAAATSLSRGVRALEAQLARDRRLHAEANALRSNWTLLELLHNCPTARRTGQATLRLRLDHPRPNGETGRELELLASPHGALQPAASASSVTPHTVALYYSHPCRKVSLPFASSEASGTAASLAAHTNADGVQTRASPSGLPATSAAPAVPAVPAAPAASAASAPESDKEMRANQEVNVADVHRSLLSLQFGQASRELFSQLTTEVSQCPSSRRPYCCCRSSHGRRHDHQLVPPTTLLPP